MFTIRLLSLIIVFVLMLLIMFIHAYSVKVGLRLRLMLVLFWHNASHVQFLAVYSDTPHTRAVVMPGLISYFTLTGTIILTTSMTFTLIRKLHVARLA